MKKMFITLTFLFLSFNSAKGEGNISGEMFGDLYYVAENHDSTYKGQNGIWFRRIYFTYDYKINENFSTRFRMEAASNDFTKPSSKLIPFVKDAYLKWNFKKTSIFLGISPTPTWELIEEFWGYRSLEKTPLDLQKFGNSRDFGISLKGKTLQEGILSYHIMFANGEGEKSEDNRFKKIMGAIDFKFPFLVIQIYGDFEEGKGNKDIYTYQGFLGSKYKKIKMGIQFANQIKEGKNYEIASGFINFEMNEKITLLLRYDKMFDPSPSGISYIPFAEAKSNLIIGGIDFKIHELVRFIPNFEYIFYDKTSKFKQDLYLRLTFHYKFK